MPCKGSEAKRASDSGDQISRESAYQGKPHIGPNET